MCVQTTRLYVEGGQNQNKSSFCILLGLFLIPLLRSKNPVTIEVPCHLEFYCLHWWREKSERWWIVNVFSFYAVYFPDVYIRWTDSCSQPVPAQCTCMLLELAAIYMALWGIKYILERRRNTKAPASERAASLCRDGIILWCDDLQYITSRCVYYSMCRTSTYYSYTEKACQPSTKSRHKFLS